MLDLTTNETSYFGVRGVDLDHPFYETNVRAWKGWKGPVLAVPEVFGAAVPNPLTYATVNLMRVIISDAQAAGGIVAEMTNVKERSEQSPACGYVRCPALRELHPEQPAAHQSDHRACADRTSRKRTKHHQHDVSIRGPGGSVERRTGILRDREVLWIAVSPTTPCSCPIRRTRLFRPQRPKT